MLKKISACACVAACLGAFGAPTMGVDDGKYVIDVPTGETYTLTADDVTAIGTLPLVKAGEGTLTVGDVLKDYNGDIYVTNGIYQATAVGAVGTTNGITHVLDGGTFNNTVTKDFSGPLYGTETFYLCGDGYNRKGALRQTNNMCGRFGGKIVFTGPVRITNNQRFDFRNDGFDMGGYTLTVAAENNQTFFLVQVEISNPGDMVVETGGLEFQSWVKGLTTAQTVTVKSGAYLSQWNSTTWQNLNLVLEDNVRLTSSNGNYVPGAYSQNVWQGPVTVQGRAKNDLSSGRQIMFYGKVSGAGGFWGGNGGWLQFYNAANTFTGGIRQNGGGVAAWGTNSIPVQGGALALTNASLHLMSTPLQTASTMRMTLPDVTIDGAGTISGRVVYASAKSLTKTGTGTLDVSAPLRVAGALDVQGGGIRICSRIPDVPFGLKWYYRNTSDNYAVNTVPADVPYRGIDKSGVTYAYDSWPGGITHTFYYAGYIRVPGEDGEDVTCNFASCIWRGTHLRIGDKDVIKFSDRTDELYGRNLTAWTRFHMTPQITLTAGWQPFFLVMSNWAFADGGPHSVSSPAWPSNFGIGVDWQGRGVTNSANYVKLLDPGDGSFLRPALGMGKGDVEADVYRPTFDGPATFGPGTAIDFGDAEPYVPFVFNGLSGCPAITNGELVVSNTWTVAHAQAVAQPLTVAAGSKLAFAAGTTLAIEDIGLFNRRADGTTLVRAADANAITGLPTLMGGRGWKLVASEDGRTLTLRDVSGSVLLVR